MEVWINLLGLCHINGLIDGRFASLILTTLPDDLAEEILRIERGWIFPNSDHLR
jgi:hypothetical protein